ncbi:MAG TPA: 2-oxo-4-hydroxy-4-carboxy-5-ureidoimidazoline decarboxylase [Vicinamibacterales bacterium]|nr:2-oxo-4-hydroxy-4-carboxy-5-ureidoimidazoline decarboxylase [Vicinamibacterales bacterium]
MTIERLNALGAADAERELRQCCGSRAWAARMAAARPFASADAMAVTANVIWAALDESDWREAFAAHPRIGGDARLKSGAPAEPEREHEPLGERWAAQEQSGAAAAAPPLLDRLAAKNREYEARFGYIFIVCATGKSADEMLSLLERRLTHDPRDEIRVAADEQRKITQLRLQKLIAEPDAR